MQSRSGLFLALTLLPLPIIACGDDDATEGGVLTIGETGGPGDGDGDPGEGNEEGNEQGNEEGDGDPGDGDGDPGDGDGDPGDGDGDPGDGDGDPGDGDGDPGDGDGDPGDGDGDPGDGDGDPGDGDGDGDEPCPLSEALIPCDSDDNDPLRAIGLGCPGGAPNGIEISASSFTAAAANSWRVANQFGSSGDWSAREGEKLLIVSTGQLPAVNNNNAVVLGNGAAQPGTNNGNPDNVQLPSPINPVDGSNGTPFQGCDGVNDCSDTLQAQWVLGQSAASDLLWFRFDLTVPAQANGYKFDFAFFSAEYPEYVDTSFNDVFVVWSTSETYTGNITFINDQPLTVTALENEMTYSGDAPQLAGTGVNGMAFTLPWEPAEPIGGGTGWYTANASADPGETFTLAWALFDMGDSIYDTIVTIDAFRWDCEGCIPNEVDSCGVQPQ